MCTFVQGTCVFQIFTNEGLIFGNCKCITISMLLCLNSKLQVNESDLFDCFERKQRLSLNEFIKHT